MAYRYGDRYQMNLMPQSIEEYVAEDNPVRAYDAFVDALDFHSLGISIDPDKVGNSEYDPKTMMKLLIYGYSYGVKSSRKLERECHHNIAFIWLMGGLKPDHKTIAQFRRKNKHALQKVLRQCAQLCIKLDLITGNVLFLDGTKIRANASRSRTHDKVYYEELLSKIDGRIEQLLADCESVDTFEEGLASYVTMNKDLAKKQDLKERVKTILDSFESSDKEHINQTDPDCSIMKSVQGSHASYNVQSVVDDKHGFIVHADAISEGNDRNQFAKQIDKANKQLTKPCKTACADAGYADTDELAKIDSQQIKVIVPSQQQASDKEESPFSKRHFTYDKEQDCYICPEGHKLYYSCTYSKKAKRKYTIKGKNVCSSCRHLGQCTTSKKGRSIVRLKNEEVKIKLEAQYEEESSQEIYARRKSRVEHPFGHIKRNLKTDAFHLRGLDGVQAETSILSTCFNIVRMITLLGVSKLIDQLMGFRMVPAGC